MYPLCCAIDVPGVLPLAPAPVHAGACRCMHRRCHASRSFESHSNMQPIDPTNLWPSCTLKCLVGYLRPDLEIKSEGRSQLAKKRGGETVLSKPDVCPPHSSRLHCAHKHLGKDATKSEQWRGVLTHHSAQARAAITQRFGSIRARAARAAITQRFGNIRLDPGSASSSQPTVLTYKFHKRPTDKPTFYTNPMCSSSDMIHGKLRNCSFS